MKIKFEKPSDDVIVELAKREYYKELIKKGGHSAFEKLSLKALDYEQEILPLSLLDSSYESAIELKSNLSGNYAYQYGSILFEDEVIGYVIFEFEKLNLVNGNEVTIALKDVVIYDEVLRTYEAYNKIMEEIENYVLRVKPTCYELTVVCHIDDPEFVKVLDYNEYFFYYDEKSRGVYTKDLLESRLNNGRNTFNK